MCFVFLLNVHVFYAVFYEERKINPRTSFGYAPSTRVARGTFVFQHNPPPISHASFANSIACVSKPPWEWRTCWWTCLAFRPQRNAPRTFCGRCSRAVVSLFTLESDTRTVNGRWTPRTLDYLICLAYVPSDGSSVLATGYGYCYGVVSDKATHALRPFLI
jgi:hypothetical protein